MTKTDIQKQLIRKCPPKYKDLIKQAIALAEEKHKEEKRLSGDDFVTHPLTTALILADLKCDTDTILAGILHSCFDKDENTKKEILDNFGSNVFELISKTREISKATESKDTDQEIVTKYILNTSKDLRSVFVKLASATHNAETIELLPEEIRKQKIQKAFNIYGKLAEYLNLNKIKKQIEENAFKRYRPHEYITITETLEKNNINRQLLNKYQKTLQIIIDQISNDITLEGRIKGKYSIYNKLKKYEKAWINPNLERIEDLLGFRLIAKNTEDCYKILEKLMNEGEIQYESFDDYISRPKPNNYQAMQGLVIFPKISNLKIEIQILTKEMHYTNTYGSASHIAYKASQSRFAKPNSSYGWVECIHKQFTKHKELRNEKRSIPIKCNIFETEKFVFTPKGKIIDLNLNDTVLDYAFRIHSEVGNSAVAAKMNNKAIPMSYIPKTGDIIQIVTEKGKMKQKESMLMYANSSSTKTKILRGLKKQT